MKRAKDSIIRFQLDSSLAIKRHLLIYKIKLAPIRFIFFLLRAYLLTCLLASMFLLFSLPSLPCPFSTVHLGLS